MRHRPNPRTRAFSLIEILLALGVLVMVVALVGPALFEQIAPRTFEYTTAQVASEIRLAREDARRTGEITLVYATPDQDSGRIRIETRLRPPDDEAGLGGAFGGQAGATPGGMMGPESGQDPFAGFAAPSFGSVEAMDSRGGFTGFEMDDDHDRVRLLLELPDGYRVTTEPPATLAEDFGFGDTVTQDALDEIGGLTTETGNPFADLDDASLAGIGGIDTLGAPLLIAVCVPDGTVISAGPVYIVDADDRVAMLRIEQASGVISCERMERRRDDDLFPMGPDSMRPGPSGPGPMGPDRQGRNGSTVRRGGRTP